ncbi:MAG: hypothetical protein CMB80_05385 [Flammeovirgaceae bacterium]|nr:hypothetical protein [Flammeovirgaceae bacterium]|tara:strand:- start:725 stop:931 length:207 start_codon:yes stop_codon:yes gene_type:complete
MNCNPPEQSVIAPHKIIGGSQNGKYFALVWELPSIKLLHQTEIHSSEKEAIEEAKNWISSNATSQDSN